MMQLTESNIMDIVLSETNMEQLQQKNIFEDLSAYINHLIINHFDELISLLYRLDISEKKLKELLQKNATENSAPLIATLIIERQKQKIKSREMFKNSYDISEEEKW